MNKTPLRLSGLIMTAVLGALAIGCASPEPPAERVITYGLTLSPTGIDPHINASLELGIPLSSVYDTLVFQDPESGAFVPGLAETWEISEDGLEYTFSLRRDVRFHDGTPFNAQAVVANLDYILNPDNHSQRAAFMLGSLEEVTAVDDHTVRLRLAEPYAPLLDSLSQVYLGMASPAALDQWGPAEYQFHQVGTGPYRFVEYIPDDHLTLARNQAYDWAPSIYKQPEAPIDSFVFKFYVDPATRMLALQAGQVDIIGELPPRDAARIDQSQEFDLIPVTIPGQPLQLMFNTRQPPTDDLQLRRSLIMSVDRRTIVRTVFGDYSPVASGPLAAGTDGFGSDPALPDYDVEQALNILAEAGWVAGDEGVLSRDGVPLELKVVVPAWGSNPEVGQLIEAAWRNLGARVELTIAPGFGQLKELQAAGGYNAIAYYTFGADPDLLRSFFRSDGLYNWTGYEDPQLDLLLDRASQVTDDPDERRRLYGAVSEIVTDEALILPIRDYVDLVGFNRRVQGLHFGYQGWFPLLIDLSLAR
ncbi:MAG: hypothetical protein A2Z37_06770 [Chloroflexi bacterium RBG_19FT_COMBO_62_14]|nr:MAG: hypothetical protein A2Z37_06770 [Chloroflexi bacterium RBG_19FT_COMBO_62_14]